VADPKSVFRFIGRSGRRLGVTIVGFTVLAAGIAMLALPGPGILVVIVGLAILGTEYAWAKRLMEKAKQQARRARDRIRRRRQGGPPDEPPAEM
jgi:uncharacterized protein (TIGR02611 family)